MNIQNNNDFGFNVNDAYKKGEVDFTRGEGAFALNVLKSTFILLIPAVIQGLFLSLSFERLIHFYSLPSIFSLQTFESLGLAAVWIACAYAISLVLKRRSLPASILTGCVIAMLISSYPTFINGGAHSGFVEWLRVEALPDTLSFPNWQIFIILGIICGLMGFVVPVGGGMGPDGEYRAGIFNNPAAWAVSCALGVVAGVYDITQINKMADELRGEIPIVQKIPLPDAKQILKSTKKQKLQEDGIFGTGLWHGVGARIQVPDFAREGWRYVSPFERVLEYPKDKASVARRMLFGAPYWEWKSDDGKFFATLHIRRGDRYLMRYNDYAEFLKDKNDTYVKLTKEINFDALIFDGNKFIGISPQMADVWVYDALEMDPYYFGSPNVVRFFSLSLEDLKIQIEFSIVATTSDMADIEREFKNLTPQDIFKSLVIVY